MDRNHFDEIRENVWQLSSNQKLENKKIYLFGHCELTERIADLLISLHYSVEAILDNSPVKAGGNYHGISIRSPMAVLDEHPEMAIVCIATRFYESMNAQLRKIGFQGEIYKLADYNTYAEYSLSEETFIRKRERIERGKGILSYLDEKYAGAFRVFCPLEALGDIYLTMSYLPYYLEKRKKNQCVLCVTGRACADTARLFGRYPVEEFEQKDLDAAIQATLCIQDENGFIAHQDRPYVIPLHKALYKKMIPLETIYKCGIFGLSEDTRPYRPGEWRRYPHLKEMRKGSTAILSPYAKSVTNLPGCVWDDIINDLHKNGWDIYTNISGDETPLPGTKPIHPALREIKSVVEYAGLFIGIRSGLCDILRTAECRKIALYPDYHYCDTKWKAIDMYAIEGFENVVVRDADFHLKTPAVNVG